MKAKILLVPMLVIAIAACGNGKNNNKEQRPDELVKLEEYYKANPTDTSALKALGRAYAATGKIEDALNLAPVLNSLVTESSGQYILGLYEQGIFSAELYRSVGDEVSAQDVLEDARIFITRQSWGELTEEETALMNECLEKIAAAS